MNKEIDNLLALICVIEWLANDLHYNSIGNGFYEKHLLADRIRDFDVKDEIKETYLSGLKFHFVDTVKEVLDIALLPDKVKDAIEL